MCARHEARRVAAPRPGQCRRRAAASAAASSMPSLTSRSASGARPALVSAQLHCWPDGWPDRMLFTAAVTGTSLPWSSPRRGQRRGQL